MYRLVISDGRSKKYLWPRDEWQTASDRDSMRKACPYTNADESGHGQEQARTPDTGMKLDSGKAPWHLVPYDALEDVVAVLNYGATKYSPRNWENGMAWSRVFAATMRHLTAWWSGEDNDKETGLSHLAHAACCIMFLLAYNKRRTGTNDRPS